MGGGGSFMYALHHPELFSSACPLSAYVGLLSIDDLKKQLSRREDKFTDQEIQVYYEQHNAVSLINKVPDDQKNAVRWFIDCGDDDFLYEGNSLVHIAMKKKEVPHEYRVREGRHSWTYWRESLPAVPAVVPATSGALAAKASAGLASELDIPFSKVVIRALPDAVISESGPSLASEPGIKRRIFARPSLTFCTARLMPAVTPETKAFIMARPALLNAPANPVMKFITPFNTLETIVFISSQCLNA